MNSSIESTDGLITRLLNSSSVTLKPSSRYGATDVVPVSATSGYQVDRLADVLLLGEPFTVWVAAGTVLVLAGVWLLARWR